MSKERQFFAHSAEEEAAGFLKSKGYRIVARNYRNALGEIDLIAYEGKTICFIEVKARKSIRFGLPEEAISESKKRHLSRTALLYLKTKGLLKTKARFDLLAISYLQDQQQFNPPSRNSPSARLSAKTRVKVEMPASGGWRGFAEGEAEGEDSKRNSASARFSLSTKQNKKDFTPLQARNFNLIKDAFALTSPYFY